MTDTAARVAELDDDRLLRAHGVLDLGDPTSPADTEAHHLVTTEMLRRGLDHGHVDDDWAKAAVLVETTTVDSPDDIEAPEGMEKAWERALADGGTLSVVLGVDGYVLKAEPSVNDVHVDAVIGAKRKRLPGEEFDPRIHEPEDVRKDWDDPILLTGITGDARDWFAKVALALDAGGDPDLLVEKGNPEPLRDYWRKGGNGKVNWGGGGDFTACVAAVSKYMTAEEAKGYCAIRHRETNGFWPGDKRNRPAQKAVGTLTLPDGAVYEFAAADDLDGLVEKHGDPSRPGYAAMHPGSTAGGGERDHHAAMMSAMPKDVKARVRSELSRGSLVESYGAEYDKGKAHASGRDRDGEPWRVSSTGTGRSQVSSRIKARDIAIGQLMSAPRGTSLSETLAFTVASHQGFIDGAMGSRPALPRTHSLGETIAGLVFGGLSGATKAKADVAKHGDPSRPGYAAMHPNGYAAARARRETKMGDGSAPTSVRRGADGRVLCPEATGGYKAGIPEKVMFAGERLSPEHSLWHHLESDPDHPGEYRLTAERAALHRGLVEDATRGVPRSDDPTFYMLGGGPAAGKSTAVASGLAGTPDKGQAVHINADDIKSGLPEYDRMRMSDDDTDFFTGASFVHEESSMLAKKVQKAAIRNGQDVVLDGTGDSAYDRLRSKVEEARAAGYKVHGVYATVPTAVALDRAHSRSLNKDERRYVPDKVVTDTHRDVSSVFPQAVTGRLFDSARLIDTSETGNATLIGETDSTGVWQIRDPARYDAFVAKGTE